MLPWYNKTHEHQANFFLSGDFVVQEETAVAIEEALGILRNWNEWWKPRFFMCDFSSIEINGVETCK